MPNQYTKAKKLGLPLPLLSEDSRRKIAEGATKTNNRRFSNIENRKKLSASMKQAVERSPESYSTSNRGRTKRIDAHGLSFQGRWELEFYEWCLSNSISVSRPEIGFRYVWNGERTYFPDFYLNDLNVFVEIKGYQTERDLAKWKHFPRALVVLRKKQIESIRASQFTQEELRGMILESNLDSLELERLK